MTHYGTLKDTVIAGSAEDIRGNHLYGLKDDKLGKISDVIFDHSTGDIRYVVVDTGGWLSTKKFLVPAEALHMSPKHEDDFEAYLTKQQIEMFPPFDESDLESDAKWSGYEGKYRAKWVADPVMHRAETDRNVTPTHETEHRKLAIRAGSRESPWAADQRENAACLHLLQQQSGMGSCLQAD
jgi:hypothetical protein